MTKTLPEVLDIPNEINAECLTTPSACRAILACYSQLMREIKFRAWLGHRMVPVVSLGLGWDRSAEAWVEWGEPNPQRLHPAVYELMEFTGVKDATGKEVYEGDIVQWPVTTYTYDPEDGSSIAGEPYLTKGVVRYRPPYFLIITEWKNKGVQPTDEKSPNGTPLLGWTTDSFEISSSRLARFEHLEPPRVCRRLQILRDWSYGESQDVPEVLGRGA